MHHALIQTLQSIVAMAVVAVGAGLIALLLGRSRAAYLIGLSCSAAAYLIGLPFSIGFPFLFPLAPDWVFLVIAPPLIEEAMRVLFIVTIFEADREDERLSSWIAFGVGYAALECGAKFSANRATVSRVAAPEAWETASYWLTPFVPFMLFLCLTAPVLALLRFLAPPWSAFAAAAGLHALHNGSVFWFYPTTYTELVATNLGRIALFVALTALIVWAAWRQRPSRLMPRTTAPNNLT